MRASAAAMSSSTASRVASNGARASTACTSVPNAGAAEPAAILITWPQRRSVPRRSAQRTRLEERDSARSVLCAYVRDVLAYGLDADGRDRSALARRDARELPRVVPRAAVRHDVARDVFDDQIVATDAHRRLQAERERARIPPDDRITVREVVPAGTDGGRASPTSSFGRSQDGVLRLERRALRPARRFVRRESCGGYSAAFSGLSQPPSQGSSPTAGTTSRSRARVAATYASRTPSASSRATSSAS